VVPEGAEGGRLFFVPGSFDFEDLYPLAFVLSIAWVCRATSIC
jgi:hypothetical protein